MSSSGLKAGPTEAGRRGSEAFCSSEGGTPAGVENQHQLTAETCRADHGEGRPWLLARPQQQWNQDSVEAWLDDHWDFYLLTLLGKAPGKKRSHGRPGGVWSVTWGLSLLY